MYVEVPFDPMKNKSNAEIKKIVLKGLIDSKILNRKDKILVFDIIPIKYAYVIYDENRKKALDKIFSFLKKESNSIDRTIRRMEIFIHGSCDNGRQASRRKV